MSQISDRTGRPVNDVKKHQKSQGKINVIENIHSVPSNVQFSHQEGLLYVFEERSSDQDDYQRMDPEPTELLLIGCSIEAV